jgi:tetraacyldisaccharide 4'-kinase
LAEEARRAGAMLVTTEKDAVRLPQAFRREALALPVRLVPEDPEGFAALLGRAFEGRAPNSRRI